MKQYSAEDIERAKQDALEWLEGNPDGYPRSWETVAAQVARGSRDEDEAPPIAGYEALEKEGLVIRIGPVIKEHGERIHFRLKSAVQ